VSRSVLLGLSRAYATQVDALGGGAREWDERVANTLRLSLHMAAHLSYRYIDLENGIHTPARTHAHTQATAGGGDAAGRRGV
jgi:hypothetical protein